MHIEKNIDSRLGYEFDVPVENRNGLHGGPAAIVSATCKGYQGNVELGVVDDGEICYQDAKNVMGIIQLAARRGMNVRFRFYGVEREARMIEEKLRERFSEFE
jgi:phosphotransferase system HPr (HPr) family protein